MIVELASQYGRYGYRRIGALPRRRGWAVNPQASGADLEAGGTEGAAETAETVKVVAQRRVVCASATAAPQPRMGLRLRFHEDA